MKGERHRAAYIPFRCSPDVAEMIGRIAVEQRRTKSEVLRSLVDKGMKETGYKRDDDQLHQAMQEAIKPHIDRLAAICAKAAQMAAAAYFMAYSGAQLGLPDSMQIFLEEAADQARQSGIAYIRLGKERGIDEFISAERKKSANK